MTDSLHIRRQPLGRGTRAAGQSQGIFQPPEAEDRTASPITPLSERPDGPTPAVFLPSGPTFADIQTDAPESPQVSRLPVPSFQRTEHEVVRPMTPLDRRDVALSIQRVQSGDEELGQQIRAASSGGISLETPVQQHLEAGLGADLSGVRIHTDGEADRLSRSVDAVAFTSGSNIFFRSGAYNPSSGQGLHLLAHEATHVIQQASGPVAGTPAPGGVSISDPEDSFEQAAASAAARVMRSPSPPGTSVPQPIQRMALDNKTKKLIPGIKERIGDEDADVEGCIKWVQNVAQLNMFTENAESWAIYLNFRAARPAWDAAKLLTEAGSEEGMLEEANQQAKVAVASRKAQEEAPAEKPVKLTKAERRKLKEEEEEREKQRKQEEQEKQAKAALELARTKKMQDYADVPTDNAIVAAVWGLAKDTYIRQGSAGQNNLGMSGQYTRQELEDALAYWRTTVRSAVRPIGDAGGVIKGVSSFPETKNKAAQGKGNVGATLDTRTWQANFMWYFSAAPGGPNINIHVDQA